jgi:hypothetical protein
MRHHLLTLGLATALGSVACSARIADDGSGLGAAAGNDAANGTGAGSADGATLGYDGGSSDFDSFVAQGFCPARRTDATALCSPYTSTRGGNCGSNYQIVDIGPFMENVTLCLYNAEGALIGGSIQRSSAATTVTGVLPDATCPLPDRICPAEDGATADAQDEKSMEAGIPTCPADVPAGGAPCSPPGQSCEYGGDAHRACTTLASCASNGLGPFNWFVYPPAPGCPDNDPSCPANFGAPAESSPCSFTTGSVSCDYDDGRCGCIACRVSADSDVVLAGRWDCRRWDSGGSGCPPVRPLAGDACETPDLSCTYGGCGISVGPSMQCSSGHWRPQALNGSCVIGLCNP